MEDLPHKNNLYHEKTNKYVLLVGEGNFSFGANFVLKTENQVIATCLKADNQSLTEFQKQNIAFIQKHGGIVYTDVDATQMHCHRNVAKLQYDTILFNFPHIPGKMKINENRKLLQNFFQSAEKLLAPKGKIHVTLCKGQSGTPTDGCPRKWSDTWQIVSLAAYSDLILSDCIPFNHEDYPNYVCSGFRGSEKQFNIEGAMTYIFRHGSPIKKESFICVNPKITLEVQLDFSMREDFQQLSKILANSHHPINKILTKIAEDVKSCITEITNLTDWPLFYNHLRQQEIIPKTNLSTSVLQNCCRTTISETLREAIPKLKKEEIFIKTALCLPCYSALEFFPHFKPCLVLCTKDHLRTVSLVTTILNSIFLNSDIKFTEERVSNLNSKVSVSKTVGDTLGHEDGSACESVAKFLNLDTPTKDEYFANSAWSIIATYDVEIIGGHKLCKNIKFVFGSRNEESVSGINALKVGSYDRLLHKSETYFNVVLDITCMAMLAYHVFDKRVLYDEHAYLTMLNVGDISRHIFRPLALHSPPYIHDISFWVSLKFSKLKFLLLIRSVLKNLVFSASQIDSYYDSSSNRHSLCYRFSYFASSQPLSKEKARDIHISFRETLRTALNIELR